MSDSTSKTSKSSKSEKSSSKPSESKATDSGSSDSSDSSTSKSTEADGGKSAKESIGGKADIHYGFFSSVRTPEYRSGWDDIWGANEPKGSGKKSAKSRANGKSKPKTGATSATAELNVSDLPDDVRDGLIEAARKKTRKSRASFDKLDASGKVEWTISVTLNGGRG